MDTQVVLSVGAILLCCGCLGLLVVRLSNPFFRGLWWLGGMYALGALGAGLLATRSQGSGLYVLVVAQTLFLLAFVLLQVCLEEITAERASVPRLGLTLVLLQVVLATLSLQTRDALRLCLVNFGLLVAMQVGQSAWLLARSSRAGMVAPVRCSAALLTVFALYNVVRSVVVAQASGPLGGGRPNPWEELTAVVFLGTALGVGFGVFWIASAQIRVALQQLAESDPLTGVANRRCFTTWCERALQRSLQTGESLSLVLIDLDHFKTINDRYGHGAGDMALCAVAEAIDDCLQPGDLLGRWGGEEFVVLLPGADARAAQFVAQRLRATIESMPVAELGMVPLQTLGRRSGSRAFGPWQSGSRTAGSSTPGPTPTLTPPPTLTLCRTPTEEVSLTVSAGVTSCCAGDTVETMIARCDRALYQAKANGRNRIVYAAG